MKHGVKLEGQKLEALFSEVIRKNTILSMSIAEKNFDQLTCIIGIEDVSGKKHLRIDPPVGFNIFSGVMETLSITFNFHGPDQVEYLFTTHGGTLTDDSIRVPFPDYVERMQRRMNFRIDVLPATQLFFTRKKIVGVMDLINVSLGGLYGVLVKHNFPFIRKSLLKKGQIIDSGYLVFPDLPDIPGQTIDLKQAEVVRVDYEPGKGAYPYRYAVKFLDMEKEEEKQLTQVVYELHRRYLRYGK